MPSSGDDSSHSATAALLVSRQPLRPCRNTPWVQGVIQAVNWIRQQQMTLLTSLGMPTWDLITSCGALTGARMDICCGDMIASGSPYARELCSQFGLNPEITTISGFCGDCTAMGDERFHQVDNAILKSADLLIPISIREGGYMDHTLREAEKRGRTICREFDVGPPKRSKKIAYDLAGMEINPQLDDFADNYTIHWTRATNHPWPDELPIDFYRSLLSSDRYPRTAFDTLCHILTTSTIQPSSNHMPDLTPTVSFSGLSPREVIPLMRWRARYSQMSFEPYGIGIKKEIASQVGVRPVQYYQRGSKELPKTVPAWLAQSSGKISDWRKEKEFRHLGPFDLNGVPRDSLIAFCLTPLESKFIAEQFRIRTIPFTCQ